MRVVDGRSRPTLAVRIARCGQHPLSRTGSQLALHAVVGQVHAAYEVDRLPAVADGAATASATGGRTLRPRDASLIAVLLGLSLVACSEADGIQTRGPATTDSPRLATASAPTPSATSQRVSERLVTQRYVEFQRVVAEVGAASTPNDARLAEYATGAVLKNLRGKLAVRRQAGTRLYGAPVPHVQSVSIAGGRATVRDCLNNSETGLVDRAGKKLSVGREQQQTTATLVLTDGAWKVSEITTVAGGGSC